jgi:hypothetical protein
LLPVLSVQVMIASAAGLADEADALRAELAGILADGRDHGWRSHAAWWMCHLGGLSDIYLRGADTAETPRGAMARALLAGDLAAAADILAQHGARSDAAYTRMLLAEEHAAAGRRAEAHAEAGRARSFYREVRAVRFIQRLDELAPG